MAEKRIVVWVQNRGDRPYLSLEWTDPTTSRRKSKSAETCNPHDAEIKRADLEADLNAGRHQEASGMSWEKFRELFMERFVAGRRPLTREKYADVLNLFEELARPRRLRDVAAETVTRFLSAMRKRPVRGRIGMGPNTMNVALTMLRTALRWAVDQDYIPKCPKFPKVKVPKRKPKPVPAEVYERLLEAMPPGPWRVFLMTAWLAGLRVGEAYALRWEATEEAPYLDFLRRRVVFPAGFVKGDEDQWVPIAPELQEHLEALSRDEDRVFPLRGPSGTVLKLSSVCDRVNQTAKRVGVKLSMHPLRRGFGCRWAGKVPAQVLQRLMRHSDIRITTDYYANMDDAVEEAILGPQRVAPRVTSAKADAGRVGNDAASRQADSR